METTIQIIKHILYASQYNYRLFTNATTFATTLSPEEKGEAKPFTHMRQVFKRPIDILIKFHKSNIFMLITDEIAVYCCESNISYGTLNLTQIIFLLIKKEENLLEDMIDSLYILLY